MVIRFPGGGNRCLTLSYDDGVRQDARLIQLMKRYGIAGTFNLNSGMMTGAGRRMTEDQCLALYKDEPLVEVACHGAYHQAQDMLTSPEIVKETMADREKFEDMFGVPCRGFAYAQGRVGAFSEEALRACGIAYARTVNSTKNFRLPENWLRLDPTCHHTDPQMMTIADRFRNISENSATLNLFYVWGHAYEFDDDDNWEKIEEFFHKVSGLKNTWYATNIQIYDYLTAARQLVLFADGSRAYNPTQVEIWYRKDGEVRTIAPGETKTL